MPTIITTEVRDKPMLDWIGHLKNHSYELSGKETHDEKNMDEDDIESDDDEDEKPEKE